MRGAPAIGLILFVISGCASPPAFHSNRMLGANAIELFGEPRVAALAEAACAGDVAGVSAAVADGVNPNSISVGLDEYGGRVTPLLWAVDCGNSRGVEALLRAGADPNQNTGGRVGLTPVLAAAGARNPAILRLLLQNGGDPNAMTEVRRETALMRAFDLGLGTESWENWNTLLDAGADIEAAPHDDHQTIATHAAWINRFDKVVELLERGYSYDLTFLGFAVQRAEDQPGMRQRPFPPAPLFPEAEQARARAQAILVQRGVRFPISREDVGIRDPDPPVPSH